MPKPTSSWPSVNPGTLRHRVQLQQKSASQDAAGQPLTTWTTVLTTWARIEAITLREMFQANQLVSQISHTITMRYQSTVPVAPGMQILFGTHTYTVQAVNNIEERGVLLRLLCLQIGAVE